MIKKRKNISWRKTFLFFATFFCIGVIFLSCKKKENSVGANGYNSDLLLNSFKTDTFSINSYTIFQDSIPSKNAVFALLGSYNDPIFGTVNASFYSQFRLQALNPQFVNPGESFEIDSIVLGLEYRKVSDLEFKGYYGKTTAQTFEVYRLNQAMHNDSSYYNFTTLNVGSENLVETGKGTLTPNTIKKTIVGKDTVDALLRIHLKNSFAEELVNESINNPDTYSSNEKFISFLKGIYVKVNNGSQAPGEGGVFCFDLVKPRSKMTIYFKQGDNAFTFDYLINNNAVRFNHVEISNSGTPVQQVIDLPENGKTSYYAQANRSRAVVEIPSLSNLPKNIIIHNAKLVLPVAYQTGKIYYPSELITVGYKPNYESEAIGTLKGEEYAVFNEQLKAYIINIRPYVQNVINGTWENRGVYLSPALLNSTVERIIFNGINTNNKKQPKLEITFTEF
jgi:hypothetical protein